MADRYIKKDAIFKLIESMPLVDMNLPVEFMKALYDIPAADVAPVRHGRWEVEENWEIGYGVLVNVCTACGCIVPVNTSRYRYCPHCGAAMEAEE